MTQIGILSDTHSTWDDRFRQYFDKCDEIWHAGDIGDYSVLTKLQEVAPVRAVCGNIDGGAIRMDCPEQLFFEVEGTSILMRHIVGRPSRYARGIPTLLRQFRPTILIGGHSHILHVKYDPIYQTLFINPGAAGTYGQQTVRTLIRLTIEGNTPQNLEVIELGK